MVVKAGLKSALAAQELKRPPKGDAAEEAARRKKKRQRKERVVNIAKATNAHLPGLFAAAAPARGIDG